uniref:Uncharacterized protein n=1 Tax=Timema monikensis TaxID=170555 RepID=A0A7R9EF80_9NEOP|nr:unnamed protein product [Timema monikensis]
MSRGAVHVGLAARVLARIKVLQLLTSLVLTLYCSWRGITSNHVVYNAGELLEYCQGFLLQNMVALLTYDDSVKRLLFGKKLHSHDVLAGLLLTLQARIKARNPRTAKPK